MLTQEFNDLLNHACRVPGFFRHDSPQILTHRLFSERLCHLPREVRGEKIVRICLLPVSHVFSSFTAVLRTWQFPMIVIDPRNVYADHRSKDGVESRAALVPRLAPDLQEKIVQGGIVQFQLRTDEGVEIVAIEKRLGALGEVFLVVRERVVAHGLAVEE